MFGNRYTIVPKYNLDIWCESIGSSRLPEDVGEILAEDVTYRIREAVHNAMQVMKHCKRTCLTVDDFNNALKESDTEPIYGHGGPDSLTFKAISFKDSRLCYVDEKEINLRETALDTNYPADPGEMSLKANWLVLEGNPCSEGKSREDGTTTLEEPLQRYLDDITKALVGNCVEMRKAALKDLAVNKKLQILLPYFLSFFSDMIKQHTNKSSFVRLSQYLLLAINALVENRSILLTPYVFQLVKMMLFIVIEAKISVNDWHVKNTAAHVLAYLCRTCTITLCNLTNQLLKSYQDSLNDPLKPLGYLYGAVIGIKVFGDEAVQSIIYPVFREKLKLLDDVITFSANDQSKMMEIILVRDALCEAISLMLVDRPLKKHFNYAALYTDIYNIYGDALFGKCNCSLIVASHTIKNNNVKNGHLVKLVRSTSITAEVIRKELDKLKDNTSTSNNVSQEISKMSITQPQSRVKFNIKIKEKLKSCIFIPIVNSEKDGNSEYETPYKKQKIDHKSRKHFKTSEYRIQHFSYTEQAKKIRFLNEDTTLIYTLFL